MNNSCEKIGNLELNKIYCMDALELLKQLPDKSVDLVLTDPPYGNVLKNCGWIHSPNLKIGSAKCKDYTNVDFEKWDKKPTKEIFDEIFRVSKNQIIFGGNYFSDILPVSEHWIVWDKKREKDGGDGELIWTSFNGAIRFIRWRYDGFLQEKNLKEKKFHPTQKPVDLIRKLIKDKDKDNFNLILDPFMGVGSTALACKHLGINFIGSEINKEYVDIANKRLKQEVLF